MNFCGEFYNTLDTKGRASIPADFREMMLSAGEPESLVVTKNLDGGLSAYPASEWQTFRARLEAYPNGKKKTAMNRLYLAPMSEVGFDKQGRIPLSKALRKWAGVDGDDRELVVVGNFRRIDIFSQARYVAVVAEDVDLLQGDEELLSELDLP